MTSSRLHLIALIWVTTLSCAISQTNHTLLQEYSLSEGEYLALEGGSLLPDTSVVSKVDAELSAIRSKYPAVRDIKHFPKWTPGQVLTTRISQDQISNVNQSSYGPLKYVEKIDVMPFFYVTVLTFEKPYSAKVLAGRLEKEFGFPCTPNTIYYEYEVDNITYRMGNSTYVFKKGTGMCSSNCPDRYLWEFAIDGSGNAEMIKEWSVPQNGERVIIY